MSARAGIVITGTEVLTGRVRDRNGPWLSDRLLELGIELAHITICGDRPEDMEAQLAFMSEQGVDLIVTSGGLGPTADDLTLEVVAGFTGRELALDEALEQRIADILSRSEALAQPRLRGDPGGEPQAGARARRRDGDRACRHGPGMVVPPRDGDGPTVVILPGPPRELHHMWHVAVETDAFRDAVGATATEYEQSMLRLFGIPESEIAETLRHAEGRSRASATSRSQPACGAARWRWSCATSPRPRRRGPRSRR